MILGIMPCRRTHLPRVLADVVIAPCPDWARHRVIPVVGRLCFGHRDGRGEGEEEGDGGDAVVDVEHCSSNRAGTGVYGKIYFVRMKLCEIG